jgi:DNA sulfur modification protein DndD
MELRDGELLELLAAEEIQKGKIRSIASALREDRKIRLEIAGGTLLLDADAQLSAHIAHLRAKVLPDAGETARNVMRIIEDLVEQIARLEAELGRVPDEDRIAHAEKITALDTLKVRAEVLVRQHKEADVRLDRFGDRNIDARVAEDDRHRMLRHSKKVRDTLAEFRTRVIRRHVTNMEVLMLEAFRTLLRKSDLVHGLTIDPETFVVTLTGPNNQVLPFDRLSAGERQLLATALLWGLARASGRPVPTGIDTPLGRLDSSHRRHLVERYFPMASHQVLLLSTDEEIVGPYHKALAPFVSRHYRLAA